jgi:hypothetical protein
MQTSIFIGENQKLLKTWVQEYAVPVEAPVAPAVQLINPEPEVIEEFVQKFEPAVLKFEQKEASIYSSDSESIAEP